MLLQDSFARSLSSAMYITCEQRALHGLGAGGHTIPPSQLLHTYIGEVAVCLWHAIDNSISLYFSNIVYFVLCLSERLCYIASSRDFLHTSPPRWTLQFPTFLTACPHCIYVYGPVFRCKVYYQQLIAASSHVPYSITRHLSTNDKLNIHKYDW